MFIEVNGYSFKIPRRVYTPSEDSFLLWDNLVFTPSDDVLEVGVGSGFVSVQLAGRVRRLVSTDISLRALSTAFLNADLNGVRGFIDFRLGSLFDPIEEGEIFSLVIFNPPYLSTDEDDFRVGEDRLTWDGGRGGREILDAFVEGCLGHVSVGGRVVIVQSNRTGVDSTISKFKKYGFKPIIKASKKFFFEEIMVIEAVRET